MSVSPALVTPGAIDWQGGLTNAWNTVANFVPKLLVFLVVLFVFWLIAKFVSKAIGMLLGKVGFDNLLAKAGAGDMEARTGVDAVSIITKLVYYFILLIGLQLALSAFGPANPVSQTVDKIVAWLPNLVVAVVIVVIAMAVANAVKDILGGVLGGVSYGNVITNIAGAFIIALGVIAALDQIGVATAVTLPVLITVLATVGGILVVGVGGGLIQPMRNRWEGWLDNISQESDKARSRTAGYTSSGATTTTAPTTSGGAHAETTSAPRAPGSTQGSTADSTQGSPQGSQY